MTDLSKKIVVPRLINHKVEYLDYDSDMFSSPEELGVMLMMRYFNNNIDKFKEKKWDMKRIDKTVVCLKTPYKLIYIYLKPLVYDKHGVDEKIQPIFSRIRMKFKATEIKNFEDTLLDETWVFLGVLPTGEQDIYAVFEGEALKEYSFVKYNGDPEKEANETSCWIKLNKLNDIFNNNGLIFENCNSKRFEYSYVDTDKPKRFMKIMIFTEEYLFNFMQQIVNEKYDGGRLDVIDPTIFNKDTERTNYNDFEWHINVNTETSRKTLSCKVRDMIFTEEIEKSNEKLKRNNDKYRREMISKGIDLEIEDRTCYIDNNGRRISEVHHIIPFKYNSAFGEKINSYGNLILLSSNQHRGLHSGNKSSKSEIMKKIVDVKFEELCDLLGRKIDRTNKNELTKEILENYY